MDSVFAQVVVFVDKYSKTIAHLVFFCYHINVFTCGKNNWQIIYPQTVNKLWIFINTLYNNFINIHVDNVYNLF